MSTCRLSIQELCDLSQVSRSGYYRWLSSKEEREEVELQDQRDFCVILKAYRFKRIHKGIRSIKMTLEHEFNIVMNKKKIQRLMRKYNLYCPLRKANPYRKMAKAKEPSEHADNIVNRDFKTGARKVLLTDITYLYYSERHVVAYLSTIKDACTNEILSYEVSETLAIPFVIKTIEQLKEKQEESLKNVKEVLIHSDQGSHYISTSFSEMIKDNGWIQSMSRRGNCWDNAPMESFFGHMKDEINSALPKCQNIVQLKQVIDYYMDYYNNHRFQWNLCKLAPSAFYQYCMSGELPGMNLYEAAVS